MSLHKKLFKERRVNVRLVTVGPDRTVVVIDAEAPVGHN